MTDMETIDRLTAAVERIADAIEVVAVRLDDSTRVATLEDMLKDFVSTMENPGSTDQDWATLLEEVRDVLGLESDICHES